MSRKVKRAKPTAAVAPAVHDDTLWDLDKLPDGMVHNIDTVPHKIQTKTEYRALLNKLGKRMKNQQESTTGPELAPAPAKPEEVIPVAPELTEGYVRTIRAFSRIMTRYGFKEAMQCQLCFQREFQPGCRVTLSADGHSMAIRCACSLRRFTCLTSFTPSNTTTLANETMGAILGPKGEKIVPTTVIEDEDARLTQRYYAALNALKLWNVLVCNIDCGEDCEQNITDDEIQIVCACRIRFWKGTRH